MPDEIIDFQNALVPVQEDSGLVAVVRKDIAYAITVNRRERGEERDFWYDGRDEYTTKEYIRLISGGRTTRVSDVFMSRYGIMGYVEYSIVGEEMSGVIEVPKKLTLILQLIGDEVYEEFKRNFQWDIDKNPENLDIPQLKGVKFLDTTYYWAAYPGYHGVGSVMKDQIDEEADSVKQFLIRLDEQIDGFRGIKPENPADDFDRINYRRMLSS